MIILRLVKKKRKYVVSECEKCGRTHNIAPDKFVKTYGLSLDLKDVIQCECGEYHNLVLGQDNQPTRTPRTFNHTQDDTIRCGRCNSTQLHADKKGFSLGKALTGGALIGGAGLLGGFAGKNKVMVTCLNCGYKWQAGR